MGWWSKLWTSKAQQWTFERLEPANTPVATTFAVTPDEYYLTVRLASLRIVNVRKGLTKFYGAVHSFMALPHRSGKPAEFNVFTSPSRLKSIDAGNVDSVIQVDLKLLDSVPYRGGDLEVEVGLFSIAEENLAAPYLTLLETISSLAGAAYVKTALMFADPLKKGIDLLTGSSDPNILEVGLRANFERPKTGYYVVMRAPKGTIDVSKLRIVGDDEQLVGPDGRPVQDYQYMVLRVDASKERPDFWLVPDVAEAYKEVKDALRAGDDAKTQDALAVFRRTVLTSDDLLDSDADRLVEKVEARVETIIGPRKPTAFGLPGMRRGGSEPATRVTGQGRREVAAELPDLADLALYGGPGGL